MNKNRIIGRARHCHFTTIVSHLQRLSQRDNVFVKRIHNYPTVPSTVACYVFSTEEETLLVWLDHYPCHLEIVDENREGGAFMIKEMYHPGQRPNPVHAIRQMADEMLSHREGDDNLWCLFITDSDFIGKQAMEYFWAERHVTVFDHVADLSDVEFDEHLGDSEAALLRVEAMFDLWYIVDEEVDPDGCIEHDTYEEDFLADFSFDDDDDFPDGTITVNERTTIKVDILKPMRNPGEELGRLVGCRNIRNRIGELLSLTRYNQMIRQRQPTAKPHEVSLHSLFLGSPGTGKTTVCKIFGALLREAGALSKGHVVMCSRSTFVGPVWGYEENMVRQLLKIAQGGVLMVDEAYLLAGNHKEDPAKMVVQLLMDTLANEQQRDIAVVLCGYKEQMKQLLDLNPGLVSRFPNQFVFDDFTLPELLDITRRRVAEYSYHFTRAAGLRYRQVLEEAYKVRDPQTWGNARFVANLLERIYIAHAMRCVNRQQPLPTNGLFTLTPADIQPVAIPLQKPKIGF